MVSVSVGWLAGRPELGLTLLAGRSGLDRPIRWAHSIELADPVPWLHGGELLLTTGLRLPPSEAERREYVRKLEATGVAALGFGVGLSFDRVPPELVDAAEQAGLPVLAVPLPTPFSAVTKVVLDRLAEQQYEGAVRASRLQPRMTRAALRGGPRAVVRELALATGAQAMLLAPDGTVVAAQPPAAAALVPPVLAGLPGPEGSISAASAGPHGVVSTQVVRVGRRVHGSVVLISENTLLPTDHLLVGHAVSLIALDLEKPVRLRDAQNRLNALLLKLLIDADLPADAADEHLAAAGFTVGDGVQVLALCGTGARPTLVAVDQWLAGRGLPCLGLRRTDCTVVLLPGGSIGQAPPSTSELRSLLKPQCLAGMAATSTVAGIRGAVRQALIAAGVARSRGVALVEFASLAGQALVADPASRAVLTVLAEARLGPLAECDRQTGTELVATLRAFLEHHGQWEAASVALGVHRHTLRARMDRIRDLLGLDLDSAHVRAELLLSLVTGVSDPPPG